MPKTGLDARFYVLTGWTALRLMACAILCAFAAQEGLDRADQTKRLFRGLAGAAMQSKDVLELISDMAPKTNFLALNATMETARAGDAGKGFSVVGKRAGAMAENVATRIAIDRIAGALSQTVGGQAAASRENSRNRHLAAGSAEEVWETAASRLTNAGDAGQSTKDRVVLARIIAGLAREWDHKATQSGAYERT